MYYALTMTDKISSIHGFSTEAELDTFATETSTFTEEERAEREAQGNDYGPAVVFALVALHRDAMHKNNYDYPFAIYLRGQRYDCAKHE